MSKRPQAIVRNARLRNLLALLEDMPLADRERIKVRELAETLGVSESTMGKMLRSLRDGGYLVVEHRPNNAHSDPTGTTYHVVKQLEDVAA